jgi:transposase
MVVGLVLDGQGRPICCELWPGNTADVKTLLPVVDRLSNKFRVTGICIVADRGMISNETVQTLETRKIEYILGARMRAQKEVRDQVIEDSSGYQVVYPPRKYTKDPSPLEVKEVWVDNRRYVVCINEEQARKDARDRSNIVEALKKQLERGDKSLVGNRGYRKFLKPLQSGFEIDLEKVDKESRYDGKWVLKTNTEMPTEKVALTYKMLWMVEQLFRTVKSLLETRPIFHKWDETIRGHVFCSFLALVLMRELQDRMEAKGFGDAEWADVLRDLDDLNQTEVQSEDGKRFRIRSELKGWCGKAYQAAAVAIPATITTIECDETR